LEVVTSFIQLGLLVAFTHSYSPPWVAIALIALPIWIVVIISHGIAYFEVGLRWPNASRLKGTVVESFRFFCFTGAMPILNRANLLILGAMARPDQVAYYAIGERIVTAATNATIPVIRVVMPRITNLLQDDPRAARSLFTRAFLGLSGLAFVGAIMGAFAAPWAVPLIFGAKMRPGTLIIAMQLFILPSMMGSRMIGTLALVPLHHEKTYQRVVLSASFMGLCVAPLAIIWGAATGLTVVRVVVELGVAAYCGTYLVRIWHAWGLTASHAN
jgi:O-antigen/teichoic acid export membrane protein